MSYPFYKQAITHGQSKSKKQEVKKEMMSADQKCEGFRPWVDIRSIQL